MVGFYSYPFWLDSILTPIGWILELHCPRPTVGHRARRTSLLVTPACHHVRLQQTASFSLSERLPVRELD
jgi:hypothetical protein